MDKSPNNDSNFHGSASPSGGSYDVADQSRFMPHNQGWNGPHPYDGYAQPGVPQPQDPQGTWAPVAHALPQPGLEGPAQYPGPWQKPGKSRKGKVIGTLSVLGLLIVGVVGWVFFSQSRPNFEAISEQCENEFSMDLLLIITGGDETIQSRGLSDHEAMDLVPTFITVSGDQSSLIIDDRNYYSVDKVEYLSGTTGSHRDRAEEFIDQWNGVRDLSILGAVGCIHDELDIPDSVENRMLSTRSLDGIQEAVHSGIRITWSYHPSRGLDIIYEKE